MYIVHMIGNAYVDDLIENIFAEWHSTLHDAIMKRGLDWTLEDSFAAPGNYRPRKHNQVFAAVRGLLHRSIPQDLRMELRDQSMQQRPALIVQDAHKSFSEDKDNIHHRL